MTAAAIEPDAPRAARPGSLLHVRAVARDVLARAGVAELGWRVGSVHRAGGDRVVLELERGDEPVVLLEWTEHGGADVSAFVVGERLAVGYRSGPDAWDLDAADTPAEVKRAAALACQALAAADAPIIGPDPPPRPADVTFEPEPFAAWLASGLATGDELVAGWRLTEVYPFGGDALAVTFAHPDEDFEARLKVRRRDEAGDAAFRTSGLDVSYTLTFGASTDPARKAVYATLAGELGLVLEALDHGVRFLPGQTEARGESPETPREAAKALNLAIPGPCGQKCSFCSVREEISLVTDPDAPLVRALRADIRRSAANGARILRINGIEPLNAPYLFDLLAEARDAGFEEFHTLSTCRPLADEAFCDRFLAAQPERFRIYVPIYGSTAAIHDAVTGAPGSFDEMLAAARNLRERVTPPDQVVFTTVMTRSNVGDLVAMRELVRPLGRWWEVHLPFPNTSSRTDRYRDVALPMRDALRAAYPDGWWPLAELELGEVLPCVALAHQRETGHRLLTAERVGARLREPAGTFYRTAGFEHSMGGRRAVAFTAATVPCPHREGCALAPVCPQKVYALYAELFGTGELRAVDEGELRDLPDGEALLAEVSGR